MKISPLEQLKIYLRKNIKCSNKKKKTSNERFYSQGEKRIGQLLNIREMMIRFNEVKLLMKMFKNDVKLERLKKTQKDHYIPINTDNSYIQLTVNTETDETPKLQLASMNRNIWQESDEN